MNDLINMKLKVNNITGKTLAVSRPCGDGISLVYTGAYNDGDAIILDVEKSGYYFIKLDDTMPETLVYIKETECGGSMFFQIPMGKDRICYSPKAFGGNCHFITAREAGLSEVKIKRNLALNPYDRHNSKGFFPHVMTNVETGNDAPVVARNAVDGIFANSSHGAYPYSSWGVNQEVKAALTIDFGRNVDVDSARITLSADFPHDNWWTYGELVFSDDSVVKLSLEKSELPQFFKFKKRTVTSVKLTNLVKSEEVSPFPALRQIEIFGKNIL